MTSQHYRDHFLDQLHKLHQDHTFVHDFLTIFKGLSHRNGMREHQSETITRFVRGLRPKIRRAMITGPYDLDIVEKAFDVALKLDLTFKS